ncbi:MAG: cytidylate kinase family protein [Candidatus Rokubacteria bacterium]|nr:cytidylate kinase family protein [Candidatus Rokubacteria bacterium]
MAIIVISHQMGAGGPEVGMGLAQRLGYRYVNQELLLDAARRYGLAEERLSHLDESKPTLFERFDTETRQHITVLQTTLLEFAELDNAVLMRGGGQWLLRGVPHALRVRIIAAFEHRVKQWIKRTAEMTGETPNQRAAADFVRRDDAEKSGRMKYLYEVDVADPTLYELIVNTEKLRYDAVVDVVERLARRPEMATTDEGRQLVASRALASRVQVALATHPETRRYRITVEAHGGTVTLEGTAALDRAVEVARTVPGVSEVKTQQLEIPPIPPFVA